MIIFYSVRLIFRLIGFFWPFRQVRKPARHIKIGLFRQPFIFADIFFKIGFLLWRTGIPSSSYFL
ncbi:MAG: hypothetical protein DRP51_10240 [Candidatus Zixiibacteriota bacterium]|nr:MAG: hypothetical protein DRP51_10240 [candidate division Zixibacteria bacterium]